MSIITGEFNFQIEDFDMQKADFYLGKNDGILYVKNCEFFPPPEKDKLNWVPTEYCFRLVKETESETGSDTNIYEKNALEDISTVPIYPIPATFDDIVPNCKFVDESSGSEENEYQTWLYYSKYAIPNCIEYIKLYVEKQAIPAETISTQYAFWIVGDENSSNENPLTSVAYNPPTILVNKLEIKIKKEDDVTVTYNGTWENMRNTFDIVRFSYIDGYDYKYKIRLSTYNNILGNIAKIETLLDETSGHLDDILDILEVDETESIKYIIEANFQNNSLSLSDSVEISTNGINLVLINLLETKITEIKNLITNNVLLYRPDDYVELINDTNPDPTIVLNNVDASGDINPPNENENENEYQYDTMYDTYAVAPVSCNDIIGDEYITFKIKYMYLNLDIVEKFKESDILPVGDNPYNILDKTILNIHGTYTDDNNFAYTQSDLFSVNNNIMYDGAYSNIGSYANYLKHWSSNTTLNNYNILGSTPSFVTIFNNNTDLSYIKKIYSTDTAFAALRFDGSVIIWGDSTYNTIYINNDATNSISIADGIGTISGYTISGIASTSNTFAAWGTDNAQTQNPVILTWGDVTYGTGDDIFPADPTNTINQIYACNNAFAALDNNDQIITWGNIVNDYIYINDNSTTTNNISINSGIALISGYTISGIANTSDAFAAWGTDNTSAVVILTWGDVEYGTGSNVFPADPTSTINQIYACNNAFAALRFDGSVITWGNFESNAIYINEPSNNNITINNGKASILNYTISGISTTSNTFAAWGTDTSENSVILTWGDVTYGTGTGSNVFPADPNINNITKIYSTDAAFLAIKADNSIVTWGNADYGGTNNAETPSSELTDSTAKEIFSNSNVFIILYRKVVLDFEFNPASYAGDVTVTVTSNVPCVNLVYTLDNTNPDNSSSSELDCTGSQCPFTVTFTIPKYRTTFKQLLDYKTQAVSEICKYQTAIDLLYKQFLDFRKCYIKQLLHMEIYTIDDYKGKSGIWYPACDHSCLKNNYNSSMKKIRYESNINLMHSMISNIRNVYHIGCLQSNLITKLVAILDVYKTKSGEIGVQACQDDPIYLFFQEFIDDIVSEINGVSQFVIFNNNPIFNKTESNPDDLKKLVYRFIDGAQMKYTTTNSNDLVFDLPVLDATELQLDDIYTPDGNDVDTIADVDLYADFANKISTIQSKYTNAISIANSKTSAFAGLQFIIGLRLRIIMDFIEYTKNILD